VLSGYPPGTTPTTYFAGSPNTTMSPAAIGVAGGSQPHNNMSPFTCVNFIIALQGIFPSRD
jgi:microcystin-dependent protein